MGEVINRRACALGAACGIDKDRERLARRRKGRENMAKAAGGEGVMISKEASPIEVPGLCATVISDHLTVRQLSPVNNTTNNYKMTFAESGQISR